MRRLQTLSGVMSMGQELERPKSRRRVIGKQQPLRPRAVFGGGTFPNADALPGAGLLRRAGPGLAGPNIQLQAPPLRRNMVETSALIPSTRSRTGQPAISLQSVWYRGLATAASLCPAVQ